MWWQITYVPGEQSNPQWDLKQELHADLDILFDYIKIMKIEQSNKEKKEHG